MKNLKSAIRTFFEEIGVDEKGLTGTDWAEALMVCEFKNVNHEVYELLLIYIIIRASN